MVDAASLSPGQSAALAALSTAREPLRRSAIKLRARYDVTPPMLMNLVLHGLARHTERGYVITDFGRTVAARAEVAR